MDLETILRRALALGEEGDWAGMAEELRNALPEFPEALDPLQLMRGEMARYANDAREMGIGYIGSCCGSVAAHVRAMAKVLGKLPTDEREWRSTTGRPMSAYEYHGHGED